MPASIEDNLILFLSADNRVTAIAGTTPPRIVPDAPSQGLAFPRAVILKTSDVQGYVSRGEAKPSRARFLIECQGMTVAQAGALRSAIRPVLSAYVGALGDVWCSRCFILDEFDDPQPSVQGNEMGVMCKTLDVELDYG